MMVLNNKDVRAKKEHKCLLCGETIRVGELHRACTIKDGSVYTARTHKECDEVTVIDRWDDMDWECCGDEELFRQRREELRTQGRLPETIP